MDLKFKASVLFYSGHFQWGFSWSLFVCLSVRLLERISRVTQIIDVNFGENWVTEQSLNVNVLFLSACCSVNVLSGL